MSEAPSFVYFVMSGCVLLLLPFVLIGSVWLRGFFWTFLRVKASGGSKCVVRAWNMTHFVFTPGWIEEGFLVFKYGKQQYRTKSGEADFYRMLKVTFVDYDLESGTIYKRTGQLGTPYDAVKNDALLDRALQKPGENDRLLIVIVVLLVVLLLVGLGQAGMLYKVYQVIGQQASQAASNGVVPA